MRGKLVVSTVVAAAVLMLAPAAQAGQVQWMTLGTNPAEVAFDSHVTYDTTTTPPTPFYHSSWNDQTIWNQLAGMINNADAGSAIFLAVYDTDPDPSPQVMKALHDAAAENPPVHIWVVDDHYDTNLAWLNGMQGEHYLVCAAFLEHHGCLSNNITGHQHSKYALFSSTRDNHGGPAGKAAWISSANLESKTGEGEYNNSIAYYSNPSTHGNEMYDGLARVFTDQWADKQSSPDYFDQASQTGYFSTSDSASVVSVSPQEQSNLWYDQLSRIDVVPGCTVRVMQSEFGDGMIGASPPGQQPASALRSLQFLGCNVAVIVHQKPDGSNVLDENPQNRSILCDPDASTGKPGIPVRSIPGVHDKIVIAGPKYNGYDNNWQVMMGSTNFSKDSLFSNDEVLDRIHGSKQLYDLYNTHWWEAWAYADNVCNAPKTG